MSPHLNLSYGSEMMGQGSDYRGLRQGLDLSAGYRLLAKYDSIESARRSAYQLAGAALREYHVAYRGLPDSEDKRFMENIIFYMIERTI